jgi:hypothetical protein
MWHAFEGAHSGPVAPDASGRWAILLLLLCNTFPHFRRPTASLNQLLPHCHSGTGTCTCSCSSQLTRSQLAAASDASAASSQQPLNSGPCHSPRQPHSALGARRSPCPCLYLLAPCASLLLLLRQPPASISLPPSPATTKPPDYWLLAPQA